MVTQIISRMFLEHSENVLTLLESSWNFLKTYHVTKERPRRSRSLENSDDNLNKTKGKLFMDLPDLSIVITIFLVLSVYTNSVLSCTIFFYFYAYTGCENSSCNKYLVNNF